MQLTSQNRPTAKPTKSSFDRRQKNRVRVTDGSLSCWHRGRRIDLHTIEFTAQGARVILPSELLLRNRLVLTNRLPRLEVTLEYRVVWAQIIAGGKAIVGLECLSVHDRRAA